MSNRGPKQVRLALLRDILPGINANKGTQNCVHCALRVDDYLKAGRDLELGPVPKQKADLLTYPIFKNGKIIRSTSEDPRLVQRMPKASSYRMICNLDDDTAPVLQLDLTDDDPTSEIRFRNATIENLNEQLRNLPSSSLDGSRYGFILLTNKKDQTIGHLLNFFVDDDFVYLVDAQQSKEKQFMNDSEFQEMMKAFLPEIFFMQSIPPEGFALKKENESPSEGPRLPAIKRLVKVKEERLEVIDEQPNEKLNVREALVEGRLLEAIKLEGDIAKLVLREKYNNPAHYSSINNTLFSLYKSTIDFQDKFKQPKRWKGAPCLKLKPNHYYTDGQAVLDDLIKFLSTKEKLNVTQALVKGDLLKGVELNGEEIKLVLKEKYNHSSFYFSINQWLYNVYKKSTIFQAKFEQPIKNNNAPCLKLKPFHGYTDGKSVQEALIRFASAKERLYAKEALAEGNLLESVALSGDNAKLVLKEKYNNPDYYPAINTALCRLHETSAPFQEKFEKPKAGNGEPHLKLKPDHGYVDGDSVQDALVKFCSTKEKLNVKGALAEGSLLEDVVLDGKRVKLVLKDEYNNPAHYESINYALSQLHKISTPFQAKFEKPKQGKSTPTLKLKPNHGYAEGQSVLDDLVSFASPKEKLKLKDLLADGDLLEGVELENGKVKLVLKEKYNNAIHYISINNFLYSLHKTSPAFQAEFEPPKMGKDVPSLKLKPNHGYADAKAVQDALVGFCATKEKLNVKEALTAGSLLEGVELSGDIAKLVLKEKYNRPDHYFSINHALFNLHKISEFFQEKFERPKVGNGVPCLKLKRNHGYADEQSVLDDLVRFCSGKERLNVKEALAEGSLLEGVELDGDNVKLVLKDKYNHYDHYFSVNQFLHSAYKKSAIFQDKFEQPKQNHGVPCLKLKPNHGFADEQSVIDVLVSFATAKEPLNVKEALIDGSLLESVELDGEIVKLILKEKYNHSEHYHSINQFLYGNYKKSTNFQDKFEQPIRNHDAPCLKLKLNHGYKDGQSVQEALVNFVSTKEKLNAKEALAEGYLLEGVELSGDNAKLVLKEKYNNSDYYGFINKALHRLHKKSTAFQAKFVQPKAGNDEPHLKLKPNHGYNDGQSVHEALIRFVSTKERLNAKEALAEGSLLESVALDGKHVKLVLKDEYDNPAYYETINFALARLHKTSKPFQAKFEKPKQGKKMPTLKLKPNHGYADGQFVQDALINFASPIEKLKFRELLADGDLLEGVELENGKVKLLLKEKYNNAVHYTSINNVLYGLYKTSAAFQAKFEPPKTEKGAPSLKLKPDHDYADAQAVQDALVSFASIREVLNVKETLREGSLLEAVELDGKNVSFVLKEKYNSPDHYFSISQALYNLHKTSAAFQEKFERPKAGNGAPYLRLKPNHGYADEQSVMDALVEFCATKEKLNIKEALIEGSLLEGVELDGENVKLILKEKYNHSDHYRSINHFLYNTYKKSTPFQDKFEQPNANNDAPCLKLKSNHDYTNAQSVQDALVSFVVKERLGAKKALTEGRLLEGVELLGNNANLVLKEEYNKPAHYFPINQVLYLLHKTSTAFRAKFEQPKTGNGVPCLKLKSNHGYANGQSVQDDLMVFAAPKKLRPKTTLEAPVFLPAFNLILENKALSKPPAPAVELRERDKLNL